MAMDAQTIIDIITAALPDADVRIEDLRGDGEHYAAIVTSASFAGKNRVQQHRMVNDAFGGKLGTTLHALQIHTRIPQEGTAA